MSEDRPRDPEWLITAGAVASLAAVSPPAAGAAMIALGVHQLYAWYQRQPERERGPDEG